MFCSCLARFGSASHALQFCLDGSLHFVYTQSLPATSLYFKHCMLYFSLTILLLSSRALLHSARDVALFSLSSLFSLTLYCIWAQVWLPYFFSSEANCLLISLINNNNNNNESLFHQKIKLHILCYNNTEDKKL